MVMSGSVPGVARLACFELWGGNSMVAHPIELPGLVGWLTSMPFGQAASGGDVHYLSVCSKGQVSRIALADVAGHGESASAVAERLRQVLRHHTDNWDQSALMRETEHGKDGWIWCVACRRIRSRIPPPLVLPWSRSSSNFAEAGRGGTMKRWY